MMRSFKTRNHSTGVSPNTRHEPMENLQRSKKLQYALVHMSKGVNAAETNESRDVQNLDQKKVKNRSRQQKMESREDLKEVDSTASRQQSQKNIPAERSTIRIISNETESQGNRNELRGPLDNQKEQRCSSLSPRRTVKYNNKSLCPKVQDGSEDIRRATDGSEDEPEGNAIELESITTSTRFEDNTTSIFESLGSVSSYKSSIVFDSMTKTEKLWEKRRSRQRVILAKQKTTQKAAIGSVASDFVSKIVSHLDFHHSLGFPTSPSLGESDAKDEDSASKHKMDEQPGDTYENKDKKRDDNTKTTLFQMLSLDEKKTRQIVDDSYERSSIGVYSQHSVGKEENIDYLDTVAEKDRLPVHNVITSFASQPLYLDNEIEDLKDQAKVKAVYPEQGLESTIRPIPEKISLSFHDSATPFASQPYITSKEGDLEEAATNFQASKDSFSISIVLDCLNCSRPIGRQQSRPIYNKQGFEFNHHLLKAKDDEGTLKYEEAATNSCYISDTKNVKKSVSNESSNLLNNGKNDDGISTLTSNYRPENTISPSTTNTIPAEIIMTESNVKVKRHINMQNGEYVDDRNPVDFAISSNLGENRQEKEISVITDLAVQNKKNSHENPIVISDVEQPVTDRVEFQKMPDNLNLFKMETTNESKDRTETSSYKKYQQVEVNSTLQAPISSLLTIPPSDASFGDQSRNFMMKEVLSKEDIVTDPEVRGDDYQRDTVERQVKKDTPTPETRKIISSNQIGIASTLEELMSNIVSSDSKEINIDNFVLHIDDLVNYLIKEGKLPGNDVSNETSDLQQMALKNNTAELLRNLSVLRARRVTALKHNKKTEAAVNVDRSITNNELSKKFEGIFDPQIRCLDTSSLAHTLPPTVLNTDQFVSPTKGKGGGDSGHSSISNIAKIRVRRNEAAMRIKQQTHKLASMRNEPSNFPSDRLQQKILMYPNILGSTKNGSDSKLLVSKKSKLPPKPEDACEHNDELEDLLSSHDWSDFSPKVNATSNKTEDTQVHQFPAASNLNLEGINILNPGVISFTKDSIVIPKLSSKLPGKTITSHDTTNVPIKSNSNVFSLLPVSNPYKYGDNYENISVTCPKHKTSTKNIKEILSFTSRMNAGSDTLMLPCKSMHSGNREFHSTTYDQLFKPAYTGTSNLRNAPRTNFNRPSVLPSPSDIDMLEWEKVELKKLPFILNPSKTEREREDSKDEYKEHHSTSEVTPTYDTDDNFTLYSDDGDTMGDETSGSASDSTRLEHIASMIEILKSHNQR